LSIFCFIFVHFGQCFDSFLFICCAFFVTACRAGTFAFTCFAARADNLWASGLAELLDMPPPVDPHAPGPFAFADTDRVHEVLRSSGWTNAAPERVDYHYIPGGGEDPTAERDDHRLADDDGHHDPHEGAVFPEADEAAKNARAAGCRCASAANLSGT
jgi:hypothetical protein